MDEDSGQFLSPCSGSDNYLRPGDYSLYANYLTKAAEDYQSDGLPFWIISMQNEPHNCNPTYPTMMMEPSDQATLSNLLSADLKSPASAVSPVPEIMGYDHNWNDYNNTPGTPCSQQQRSTYPQSLFKHKNSVSDIAYHSYCGLSYIPTGLPANTDIYLTESTGFTAANDVASNLVYEVKNDLVDPLRNGVRASLYWNLVLDQNCGPQFGGGSICDTTTGNSYGGCMDCRPMITVDNQAKTVTINQDYYYWAQFSKFVKPGAVRIASSVVGSLDSVAFKNPDGSIVVVVVSGAEATNAAPAPTATPQWTGPWRIDNQPPYSVDLHGNGLACVPPPSYAWGSTTLAT